MPKHKEEYPGEFDDAIRALERVREIAIGHESADSDAVAYIDRALASRELSAIRRALEEFE